MEKSSSVDIKYYLSLTFLSVVWRIVLFDVVHGTMNCIEVECLHLSWGQGHESLNATVFLDEMHICDNRLKARNEHGLVPCIGKRQSHRPTRH